MTSISPIRFAMNTALSQNGFRVLVVCVLTASTSFVSAQVVYSGSASPQNPALLPGLGTSALAQSQLTPEQFQNMAQLRYLQSRRRGQVRTGVPQSIPFGPDAMMPLGDMQMDDQGGDSSRKSSTQHCALSLPKLSSSKKKFTPRSASFTVASSAIVN